MARQACGVPLGDFRSVASAVDIAAAAEVSALPGDGARGGGWGGGGGSEVVREGVCTYRAWHSCVWQCTSGTWSLMYARMTRTAEARRGPLVLEVM